MLTVSPVKTVVRTVLSLCHLCRSTRERKRKKKTDDDDGDDALEDNYEKNLEKRNNASSNNKCEVKNLLPTKCKERGIIRRTIEVPRPPGRSYAL
jgi:hypothetical protein